MDSMYEELFTLRCPHCLATPPADYGTDSKDDKGRYWCPSCGRDFTDTVELFIERCLIVNRMSKRKRRQANLVLAKIGLTLTFTALLLIPTTRGAMWQIVAMVAVIWWIALVIKLIATGNV